MFGETTTNEENRDRQNGFGLQTSALNQKALSLARAPLAQISSFNEKVSALFQRHRMGVKSNCYDKIRVKKGQQYQMVFNLLGRSDDFNFRGREPVWVVKSVSSEFLSLPHARLVNQKDPRDIRTISCYAIAERRFYRPVS